MDELLDTREETHGNYGVTAQVAQQLKHIIQAQTNVQVFPPVMQESLDLICTKIGRIVAGNAHEPDHWKDIAGYANLVVRDLD